MNAEILNGIQSCLISIFLALLSATSVVVISYINKAKDDILAKLQNDLSKDAIEQIDSIISSVVSSIEQETAKDLREKLRNGDDSVSREDLTNLRDVAFNTIIDTIGEKVLNLAKKNISNIDQYIYDRISEEVRNIKSL